MSEDQRMSRNPREPAKDAPDGAQRWADYLEWVREDVIEGVLSLPDPDQSRSILPSGWSPIELLNHLLHMEQRWFVWGFLGEPVSEPWGDWNVDDPLTAAGQNGVSPQWQVKEDATVNRIAAALRAMGDRTRHIITSHPLSQPGSVGGRFNDEPPTLEWICFHVLAEYARHAGQFDVVQELSASGT